MTASKLFPERTLFHPAIIGCVPDFYRVEWSAMSVMDVHATPISSLPENIGSCTHLRQIAANGCRISHVPSSIRTCRSTITHSLLILTLMNVVRLLHELDLTGNRLTSLNVAVGQLVSLRYLLLAGNQLRELPATLVRFFVAQRME